MGDSKPLPPPHEKGTKKPSLDFQIQRTHGSSAMQALKVRKANEKA